MDVHFKDRIESQDPLDGPGFSSGSSLESVWLTWIPQGLAECRAHIRCFIDADGKHETE